MVNNKSNKVLFIICSILGIIFILAITYVKTIKQKNHKEYEYFENTILPTDSLPITTSRPTTNKEYATEAVSSLYKKDSPPEMKSQGDGKKCNAEADIVGTCIDYDLCCGTTAINNNCFCNHPFTKKCRDEYKGCISDTVNISKYSNNELIKHCSDINRTCCLPYNDISIDTNKFEKSANREQNDNLLCSISPIDNIEQKCMEICETNPYCAGYSIKKAGVIGSYNMGCNLYRKISKYQPDFNPSTGKREDKTNLDFYIKK